MILQTSFSKQIETIITLAGVTDRESIKKYSSVDNLRRGYRTFLQSLGQRDINVTETNPSFVKDADDAKKLRVFFSNDSLLDDKAQAAVIDEQQDDETIEKEDKILCALNELSLYSTEHSTLLKVIITDIRGRD
ncbi:hypothetical protein [Burkholderia sp. L27(2015)]|jgi:hypothetical protein|uniref:hypothetical protein n=1 Tax=Burkholderia sp. L27(2015) TaxID=1641858 RepID=UPI001C204096|nr:hypothetical protein [Burkholderia sp. L27(2015)]